MTTSTKSTIPTSLRTDLERVRDGLRDAARLYERAAVQNPRAYVLASEVKFEVAQTLLSLARELDMILEHK
jgi:hypothetical protein